MLLFFPMTLLPVTTKYKIHAARIYCVSHSKIALFITSNTLEVSHCKIALLITSNTLEELVAQRQLYI